MRPDDEDESLTEEQQKRKYLITKVILPTIVLIAFIIAAINYFRKGDELISRATLTNGKLLEFSADYRGHGGSIKFEYTVKGHYYTDERGINLISSRGYDLQNHYFSVMYDSLNPQNSMMMITPGNFKFFDLPFPDSLAFVKDYLND